ncbi:hypothetical protein SAMN04488244_1503 [Vibrio hangzhouensis]|uniref:Uncharacterized protein n=1 Tax=Vibrio hangzhouensis TaxID=462991 RepID=A0A1H6CQN1_9VIBR|nr:hypothetical protein SAMN04488244_1503 [Vibrio hangzhouensis]
MGIAAKRDGEQGGCLVIPTLLRRSNRRKKAPAFLLRLSIWQGGLGRHSGDSMGIAAKRTGNSGRRPIIPTHRFEKAKTKKAPT